MTHAKKSLFFLALLPPQDLQQKVKEIKLEFAECYQSRHALKSPPHITLFPPFRWLWADVGQLDCLSKFCRTVTPIPVELNGFGAFAPKVIYIKPLRTPQLLDVYDRLQCFLETKLNLTDPMAKKRAFSPHITVAHRDLTPERYKAAWAEFQGRSLQASFVAKQWEIRQEWPFGTASGIENRE